MLESLIWFFVSELLQILLAAGHWQLMVLWSDTLWMTQGCHSFFLCRPRFGCNWTQCLCLLVCFDCSFSLPSDTQLHILCEECNGHSDMSTHECRMTRNNYLNTEEFIDAVAEELRAKLWLSKLWVPCQRKKPVRHGKHSLLASPSPNFPTCWVWRNDFTSSGCQNDRMCFWNWTQERFYRVFGFAVFGVMCMEKVYVGFPEIFTNRVG